MIGQKTHFHWFVFMCYLIWNLIIWNLKSFAYNQFHINLKNLHSNEIFQLSKRWSICTKFEIILKPHKGIKNTFDKIIFILWDPFSFNKKMSKSLKTTWIVKLRRGHVLLNSKVICIVWFHLFGWILRCPYPLIEKKLFVSQSSKNLNCKGNYS